MTDDQVFYPNNLTKEEIEQLDGWKLKVATLHFGEGRSDCRRYGYGYAMMASKNAETYGENTIHLVSDSNGPYRNPIDLWEEIDWDNDSEMLLECDIKWEDIAKQRITDYLFEEDEDDQN